jgi:hypothetical protein
VIVADQEFIDSGYVGNPNNWVQTSYNTKAGVHINPETLEPSEDQSKALRKNYAGIGFVYDRERDAFYLPQPYPSWVLDEFSCVWKAPIDMPNDGKFYDWDEENTAWVLAAIQPE